ncbi:disease resistance protein RPH8A-like [Ipomoea triloba]|uniref:disease resistance protein RPH8A-like n=1 Tax=Ipomoea triloba TaxID=35885 RepID=UPI00125CEF00|nr:disease resistance protein RPH8A-like [Ipomoea triloba]
MACVALTSLMATIEFEFVQPTQRVSLHDHAPIKSFFENLSSLQAFLQKESSGDDGGALREVEIQIRDFALGAEDDIEIQLSNILLAEDGEYREKASNELHQTLREAAKNATVLLKILVRVKESCVSETEMAIAALTTLMTTFEYYFLHPLPTVSLDDEAAVISFFENFSSLQASLQKESGGDGGAAIKKVEIKIRNFALKAEDCIEMQVNNFLLAKDTEHEEEASQELRQTMQDAAENAAELLKIFNEEIDHERVTKMTCVALTSLIETIKLRLLPSWWMPYDGPQRAVKSFLGNLTSLKAFLQKESIGDGGVLKDLEIQIRNVVLKAEGDIQKQLGNFLARRELNQTLQEAAKSATELLKILTRLKESCLSEREMASAALTILMTKFDYYFLEPIPLVSLDDEAIMPFFEDLSSLHAFLQEESSGDSGSLKDLEIQIRNFALKAEDDIKIQLGKKFASVELRQTLREASKNATQLLKITRQKESCLSERKMASASLSILITKLEYFFSKPTPFESSDDEDDEDTFLNNFFNNLYLYENYLLLPNPPLNDEAGQEAVKSFFRKLCSLQAILQRKSNSSAAIRKFARKAEVDIDRQLKKFHTEHDEEATQELYQTIQVGAKMAAEIIDKEEQHEREREMACVALTSLRATIGEIINKDFLEKFSSLQLFLREESTGGVALSSLKGAIEKGFLDDEAARESFLENISSLQAFLQKESTGGAAVEDLETKIKDFALKAGDDIKIKLNNFLLTKDTEYQEKVSQELHQTMREAAKSAAQLLKLSNEVDETNETQPSNSWLKHASKSISGSSQSFLKLENRMVGRHDDCRVIKDHLISSRSQLKLISIVGMVGIGKTTLAKKVYGDPSVALHFNVRGWITIPQDYTKRQMLCDLLQFILPAELNVIKKGSTTDELEAEVRLCLLGKRYLIVLDNILSTQAWFDIIQCLPTDKGGSCILLTTSHLELDYYSSDYVHNMTLLDPKESWDLFCDILPIKEHMAPKFEKIRNHVVEKCDGLPQLIVEVAKRLSECDNIQQGWKKIEKELESLGILDRNSITVSYNPLPHHLKVCFLYFGVFPKRKRILVKMLTRLWIAEGFVKPLNHNELEDEAYMYLQELIDRSLLLIEDQSFEGKIKICRMHSALHSFCVGEAQKEGILCTVNTKQHPRLPLKDFANSCRWLSFCPHSFDYYVHFSTNIPRSIFFFLENPEMFVPLKVLRVLAFDTSIFLQRVPLKLGNLVFLRYLSVTQWFEDLDDVVSKNLNLQTLVVSSNGAPSVHLPSSIWKPPHLRHHELGNLYIVDPPSMVKENLQSLSCVVRPIHCRKEVYDKFPNIKKLKIFLKDDTEASATHGSCSNPIILDHLAYLEGLEKLSISISTGCIAAFPEWAMYPSRLKKLKLSGTNISERDLTVIAMLRELRVLKLENAFHGTVWNSVVKGGFYSLNFLLLEAKKLKQWVASSDQFPVLKHLVLKSCYCLERIPERFARTSTPVSIELEGCHSSLVASAKRLQRKKSSKNLKIKILDPKCDESQNKHTKVSIEYPEVGSRWY